MIDALVRMSGHEHKQQILEEMEKDPGLAQVFLLVDGSRSQGEILRILQEKQDKGASSATVSRKLDHLHRDLNLIHFVRRSAAGNVYRPGRLAHVLGIARSLNKKA